MLQDIEGFFTDSVLPDTIIVDNNMAQYLMINNSSNMFNSIIDSQYR